VEFFDFQIRAWCSDKEREQVRVQSSPVGEMRRPVFASCGLKRRSFALCSLLACAQARCSFGHASMFCKA
jgi:hypothetical protein